jgi:hypothetical protein
MNVDFSDKDANDFYQERERINSMLGEDDHRTPTKRRMSASQTGVSTSIIISLT